MFRSRVDGIITADGLLQARHSRNRSRSSEALLVEFDNDITALQV